MKALLILIFASLMLAQDNSLSIQGVLRQPSGKAVADGTYSITFSFYTVEVGGSPIANGTKIQDVEIKDGLYNANVDITGIPFNAQYYIGIKVGSDPELAPRAKLTAAPYALSLRGLDNIFPSTGAVQVGDSLKVGGHMTLSGNLIGTVNTTIVAGFVNALNGVQTTGSLFMPGTGVIQRGGTFNQVTTQDLGLYSLIPNNFMKFVTNNGQFHWYADGGTNPNGSATRMVLEPNGNLSISGSFSTTAAVTAGSQNITGEANMNRFRTHAVAGTIRGIIAGTVDGTGAKTNGIGFTSTRVGNGHFRVTMTGQNTTNYSVTATFSEGNFAERTIGVANKQASTFDVHVWLGTNGDNRGFAFQVILY